MSDIILFTGLGVFLMGGVGLLIAAFKTSLLWGFGCLLLPPVAIVYLFVHWEPAKGPFLTQVFGVILVALAVYEPFDLYEQDGPTSPVSVSPIPSGSHHAPVMTNQKFRCDGRIHCSEMTSCAEATWFLKNCPNTQMNGDRDRVPCESQWCG